MSATRARNARHDAETAGRRHAMAERRTRCTLCNGKGWYLAAYPERRIECPDRSHVEPVPDRLDWPDDADELDGLPER